MAAAMARKKGRPRTTRRRRLVMANPLLSCNQRPHDVSMHIGEPEISALEAVGQPRVLHAQKEQDGGLQVVDVNGVGADVEAEFVGSAVGDARPGAAAGQENSEGKRMVIAAQVLAVRCAAFAEW